MSLIISIDGNIGTGKTTFINELKKKNLPNVIFVDEPVELWTKICVNDETILEKFYEDQIKYAFSFQMMALISRIQLLKKAVKDNPNAIIVTERSLYSDKNIFAKLLYDEGKIDPHSYQIYNLWFSEYIKELPKHKFIYLYSDPKTAHERIIKRSRNGEQNINIDYLINCEEYHKFWFEYDNSNLIAKINMDHYITNTKEYEDLISNTADLLNNKKYSYKYNNELVNAYCAGAVSMLFVIGVMKFYYFVK